MSIESPALNGSAKRKSSRRSSAISYKEATSSDEEDSKPLTKRRKTIASAASESVALSKPVTNGTKARVVKSESSDLSDASDSDVPLTKRVVARRNSGKAAPKAAVKKDPLSDSDSDAPLAAKKARARAPSKASAANSTAKSGRSASVASSKAKVKTETKAKSTTKTPSAKAASAAATKKSASAKSTKTAASTKSEKTRSTKDESDDPEAEDEDDEYRWWEQPEMDGSIKWTTLQHQGVLFPPDYVPLPSDVHLIYDGVPVSLHVEAEEVAGFFGMMLNSTHNVENPVFQANFFKDFQDILKTTGGAKSKITGKSVAITDFDKCDFSVIFQHYEEDRARKRAMTPADKKEVKAAREKLEAPYLHCLWDGRKQRVGNFRVEPPSLFRGRGDHPKTGRVKKRVMPEQITINIDAKATVPDPPAGHRWKEVKHDQAGTWLAMWQENVNGNYKYVMLAADSAVKGQSDFKKFEKARELKKHIDRIRRDYTVDLKSEVMADRQRATAVYLIDKLALRAGNEKGEEEAETVGCCSLKFEHITLKPPRTVVFDFLGKDSIRYYDEVEVDPQVFKNLKIFKKAPKTDGDEIFDRLTTTALNKHLGTYMQGLTAKVFRTFNASYTFARLLQELKKTPTMMEQIKDYNEANRQVAILCNHKRTVGASHAVQIEKMRDKIDGMRYQMWRTKRMMLDLDPKLKKKLGAAYFELPDDFTTERVQAHIEAVSEENTVKITKKFEKDNQKLEEENEKVMPQSELKERLKVVAELRKKMLSEMKTKKVEAEGKGITVEKLEGHVEKLQQRIDTAELQLQDKDDNKEVALSTSKINYIDPRLTVVFCKKFDVPIEKLFSKSLREKFTWAIQSVEADWEF